MSAQATKFTNLAVTGNLTVGGTTIVDGVISGDTTLATDKKLQLRDTGIYLNSGADGKATLSADGTGADDITLDGSVIVNETLKSTLGIQAAAVARTATADGSTTGTIAAGTSYVTVTCDDANKIIILPAPVVGNIIHIYVGATGYELRSSTPASIAINGGSGANAESAIGANTLVVARCVSATAWVATQYGSTGTESAVEAAA